MTPQAMLKLLRQLYDFLRWVEHTRPGSLDVELIGSTLSVVKSELFELIREGAK